MALALLLTVPSSLFAQTENLSFSFIQIPGDSLRDAGDMHAAIDAYKKSIAPGNILLVGDLSPERSTYFADVYNHACAFAQSGKQDSALNYLERHVKESHDGIGEALSDPEFIHLRKSARWLTLEDLILKDYCDSNKLNIKDLKYAKSLWFCVR